MHGSAGGKRSLKSALPGFKWVDSVNKRIPTSLSGHWCADHGGPPRVGRLAAFPQESGGFGPVRLAVASAFTPDEADAVARRTQGPPFAEPERRLENRLFSTLPTEIPEYP